MNCKKCGNELTKNKKICEKCGEKVEVSTTNDINPEKKKSKRIFWSVILLLLLIVLGVVCYLYFNNKPKKIEEELEDIPTSEYRISGNALENFDLYFLQQNNEKENKVYSPLSIKYALKMLEAGADGNTKAQISNVIGDYEIKSYTNSENLSLANALFVKNSHKKSIKKEYVNTLKNNYNAEVVYDNFKSADKINSWISDKTYNMIQDPISDVSDNNFILVNTVAIDMNWVKEIQRDYNVSYVNTYERFSKKIIGYEDVGFSNIPFEGISNDISSLEIGAVANKYDIVKTLGEDTIRKTVKDAYDEWYEEHKNSNSCEFIEDMDSYLDTYIEEIDKNYGDISSSTDFTFYVDDDVKVFAKDLQEYNGLTLQYVGIMPTTEDLNVYIKNLDSTKINDLINNLKGIELDNFKEGVLTELTGYIPIFDIDYTLDLISPLKELGIQNVFDYKKANLSNMTTSKTQELKKFFNSSNISFSNEGIKAASVAIMGYGDGAGGPCFYYGFDVPIEEIDLTFNRPYLFLILNKETKEVWFMGSVYEPSHLKRVYANTK